MFRTDPEEKEKKKESFSQHSFSSVQGGKKSHRVTDEAIPSYLPKNYKKAADPIRRALP